MFAVGTELHLWASLSAPACVLFALRAADGDRLPECADTLVRPSVAARALAAALIAVVAILQSSAIGALAAAVFLSMLAYLAAVDLRYLAAPVLETVIFLVSGLGFAFVTGGGESLAIHCGAALAAWLGFRTLDVAYVALRGRSGLGAGDALIAAVIGAWQSFGGVAWATAIGGAAVLLWAGVSRWPKDKPLPLAPGLAVGAAMAMLAEGVLREWL
ncbi:MAG: leader peptidase PilD [Alphaproteobacteria bacterium]|nr:MAG: leader peptidase PilD [Caulobacteraceae bacterium]TPW07056.1 MAG: leader peptidase PilD [Alphaproteobacteria bacterium]